MIQADYTTVEVKGYRFYSEQDAIDAVEHCNTYYQYSPWTQYWIARYDDPVFWFILEDESLVPVLGQPIQFQYKELNP